MKHVRLLLGAALALTSAWAIAQDSPESLLPPGFDRPAPKAATPRAAQPAAPAAAAAAAPRGDVQGQGQGQGQAVVQPLPTTGAAPASGPSIDALAARLPSLDELEALSPDELGELLGLKPSSDIPADARRAMTRVGLLDESEGGMPSGSLSSQDASLVRAALAGNRGVLVSRWAHVLLRRALASRLDAPTGMNPADFAALRAALLVRMGEGEVARALVQDVDTANYTPDLTGAALDSYVATADFTGMCPMVLLQGNARKEPQWQVSQAICAAFQGDPAAMKKLDQGLSRGVMPRIDMLLAQKYAGAAGKARRAVKIEWDGVQDMTPWRYGLTIAVGLQPPETLIKTAGFGYDATAATAPMLGLVARAQAADRAAAAGKLSSAAMVDLYSQIYASDDIAEAWSTRADQLRQAYVASTPAARLTAIKQLWDDSEDEGQRYSRQVLTAYAAARLPVDESFAADAGGIVASMLAAGLDGNALRWARLAEEGSDAWAQLALAAPTRGPVSSGALGSFHENDASDGARKSAFLLAGLAGLDRVSADTARDFAGELGVDLYGQTRWTRMIGRAAEVDNAALVALLAGLGMQGSGWDKMTPRYLYAIVSALRRVGLEPEARMIAAEAVARA